MVCGHGPCSQDDPLGDDLGDHAPERHSVEDDLSVHPVVVVSFADFGDPCVSEIPSIGTRSDAMDKRE